MTNEDQTWRRILWIYWTLVAGITVGIAGIVIVLLK